MGLDAVVGEELAEGGEKLGCWGVGFGDDLVHEGLEDPAVAFSLQLRWADVDTEAVRGGLHLCRGDLAVGVCSEAGGAQVNLHRAGGSGGIFAVGGQVVAVAEITVPGLFDIMTLLAIKLCRLRMQTARFYS